MCVNMGFLSIVKTAVTGSISAMIFGGMLAFFPDRTLFQILSFFLGIESPAVRSIIEAQLVQLGWLFLGIGFTILTFTVLGVCSLAIISAAEASGRA